MWVGMTQIPEGPVVPERRNHFLHSSQTGRDSLIWDLPLGLFLEGDRR